MIRFILGIVTGLVVGIMLFDTLLEKSGDVDHASP